MVETDIEAEVMYKVAVYSQLHDQVNPLKHLVMSETTTVVKEHLMTGRNG